MYLAMFVELNKKIGSLLGFVFGCIISSNPSGKDRLSCQTPASLLEKHNFPVVAGNWLLISTWFTDLGRLVLVWHMGWTRQVTKGGISLSHGCRCWVDSLKEPVDLVDTESLALSIVLGSLAIYKFKLSCKRRSERIRSNSMPCRLPDVRKNASINSHGMDPQR